MSLCKKLFKMKHLTIYVLCLFITPIYAQKGLRSKLNDEINVQTKIKSTSSQFLEAKVLLKSEKTVNKFAWNESLMEWEFTGSTNAIYSSTKELMEEIEYDINGQALTRISYSIDATKLIAITTHDSYKNGTWEHDLKTEIEKNADGRIIRAENFYWKDNTWQLSNGEKTIIKIVSSELVYETDFTIDENTKTYLPVFKRIITINSGQISEIITQSFTSNGWINIYAEGYDYNASGKVSDIIYLTWNGTQWVNVELYTNIDWYNYEKNQFNMVELKVWNNNSWVSSEKAISYYKPNGGVSSIHFNYMNNEWAYSYRLNEDFDLHNNPKSYKVEQFENNTWKTLIETSIEYSYDASNRLVQTITRIFDGTNWYNLSKEEIEYKNSTGITHAKLELSVYPNPTTDYFQLNMKEATSGVLNIYNQQGQLIVSQNIENPNEKRIDLSEFSEGTYIVNFISGYEVFVAKVVKSN